MTISSVHSYRVTLFAALAITGSGISFSGGIASAQDGTSSKGGSTQSRTLEEVRGLVAELEEQAERQRSQLRMSEASLRRAKSLLVELEGDHGSRLDGPKYPRNSRLSPEEERSLPDQAAAVKQEWRWDEERTSPQSSMRQLGEGYKLQTARTKGEPWSLTFTLNRGGQADYSWDGHENTVFVRGGDVLYRADFRPNASGCAVIAYDLRAGTLLWKAHLWGVPVSDHSKYRNRINLEIVDRYLTVYGDESYGRYIELLDPRTGKTVGHRVVERPNGIH